MEIENVAVLPVPDCACAITSRPWVMGRIARCWMAEGFSKSVTFAEIHYQKRYSVQRTVGINTTDEVFLQTKVVESGNNRNGFGGFEYKFLK
jgi:hypothetical protein